MNPCGVLALQSLILRESAILFCIGPSQFVAHLHQEDDEAHREEQSKISFAQDGSVGSEAVLLFALQSMACQQCTQEDEDRNSQRPVDEVAQEGSEQKEVSLVVWLSVAHDEQVVRHNNDGAQALHSVNPENVRDPLFCQFHFFL